MQIYGNVKRRYEANVYGSLLSNAHTCVNTRPAHPSMLAVPDDAWATMKENAQQKLWPGKSASATKAKHGDTAGGQAADAHVDMTKSQLMREKATVRGASMRCAPAGCSRPGHAAAPAISFE